MSPQLHQKPKRITSKSCAQLVYTDAFLKTPIFVEQGYPKRALFSLGTHTLGPKNEADPPYFVASDLL